jgi:DNA-binding Lrp family transcriptional regulator
LNSPQIRVPLVKKTMPTNPELDRTDVRLLEAVQRDARQTLAQLAHHCASSPSSVARRLQRLEQLGVVTGYTANVSAHGLGYVQDVFVEVTLRGQDGNSMSAFEEVIGTVQQVLECWLMSGEFDYLLRVVTRDAADYENVHRKLSQLPGVWRLRSSFAMRQVLQRPIQVP